MTSVPAPLIPTITVGCPHCGTHDHRVVGQSPDLEMGTCANEFTFVECAVCRWTYLRNRPADSAVGVIYPEAYAPHNYSEYLGPFVRWLRRRVLSRKARWLAGMAPAAATVVDVGCGNGDLLRDLRALSPCDWKFVGIDISATAINALRASGLEGYVGRFEEIRWPERQVDLVLMVQTIEHLEDPMAALFKAFAILSPGGAIVVETPSLDGWDARLFRRRYWGGWHSPRHWTLFDRRTLGEALEAAGFQVAATNYLLSPNCWILSVHNWLVERGGARWLARFCEWRFPPALAAACTLDLLQLLLRSRTSNLRMVGRKPPTIPEQVELPA